MSSEVEHRIYHKEGNWIIAEIHDGGKRYLTVGHLNCDGAANTLISKGVWNMFTTEWGDAYQISWADANLPHRDLRCIGCNRNPRSKYFNILVDMFKAYGE